MHRLLPGLLAAALLAGPAAAQPPVLDAFDEERAFALLVEQVEFGPRVPGSEAHAAQLAWMRDELGRYADRVVPHRFRVADPYGEGALELTNLKASFRPELERRIAFAAHWDTRPRADQEKDPSRAATPIDGANDGASGVAVLLELARVLAEHPPAVGVDLLFFDGEDYGREGELQYYLLGSKRFVADFPRYRPEMLVLLDMVGGKGMRIPMEGYSLQQAPEATHRVFSRAAELGLSAFDPVPGDFVVDDHIPFLQVGVPSVDLIDRDYRWWHTLGDTPENCSPASLGQAGKLVLGLIFIDYGA